MLSGLPFTYSLMEDVQLMLKNPLISCHINIPKFINIFLFIQKITLSFPKTEFNTLKKV